ncbi:MAG TPA: 30S ribosomal protein S6 [Solirubrobacteraceae bacterium]|jgi:small subunit ribosomal protein S6|nr:30S ribosomal protein S6 [Solirubrobacteraceae bacterium]
MTLPPPIYDLVLLLDPQLEEPARVKIVADARAAIEADGELVRDDAWGERALAYPIARKTSAEYHLLQFHAGTPRLLETLEHSLRIIDGILRFRIIKLKPGVPDAPDMRSSAPPRRADAEPAGEQPAAVAAPQRGDAAPAEASGESSEAPATTEPAAEPAVEVEVEVGEPS